MAKYRALQVVNQKQKQFYWEIGQLNVERLNQYSWAKSIIEQLATELQSEFFGVNGFLARNFWRMRALYLEYSISTILQPVVEEIGWTQNILILER